MTCGAVNTDREDSFLSSQQHKYVRRRESHDNFCETGS
jgi:hypothetical protein